MRADFRHATTSVKSNMNCPPDVLHLHPRFSPKNRRPTVKYAEASSMVRLRLGYSGSPQSCWPAIDIWRGLLAISKWTSRSWKVPSASLQSSMNLVSAACNATSYQQCGPGGCGGCAGGWESSPSPSCSAGRGGKKTKKLYIQLQHIWAGSRNRDIPEAISPELEKTVSFTVVGNKQWSWEFKAHATPFHSSKTKIRTLPRIENDSFLFFLPFLLTLHRPLSPLSHKRQGSVTRTTPISKLGQRSPKLCI